MSLIRQIANPLAFVKWLILKRNFGHLVSIVVFRKHRISFISAYYFTTYLADSQSPKMQEQSWFSMQQLFLFKSRGLGTFVKSSRSRPNLTCQETQASGISQRYRACDFFALCLGRPTYRYRRKTFAANLNEPLAAG